MIIGSYVFYNKYLSQNDQNLPKVSAIDENLIKEGENNKIKNLKYEINLNENNRYIITSAFSELINLNDHELVKMQVVEAKFLDKNQLPLLIKADNANYNNQNYNTNFRDNISIEYLKNKIFSDKLDLNFENNTIKIYGNVTYESELGIIKSDNILINLMTKEININMNDDSKTVELTKY
tara:strand:- start:9 stop:548 length:540 start_codon:yes stop_codon:yes gene_type:complete